MLLRFLKWIGLVLISFIFVLALLYGGFHLWEYISGKKYVDYLNENNETKPLSEKFNFQLMQADIEKSRLILVGEIHGSKEPNLFDFDFFKHLNQKHQVKTYLAELDVVQAAIINQYLNTGDSSLLSEALKNWVVAQGRNNKDYYNKFRKFHKYYQEQDENHKFKFVGLDRIQDMDLVVNYLNLICSDSIFTNTKKDLGRIIVRLDSIKSKYSGDTLSLISDLRFNLNLFLEKKGRDEIMFLNLMRYYNSKQFSDNEKLYGYFGLYHIFQYQVNHKNPFASLVRKSDLVFADKILSVNFVLNDSYMVMPSKVLPEMIRDPGKYTRLPLSSDNMLIMYMVGIKDFKRITPEFHKSIFKLNAQNSPYKNSDRLTHFIQILPLTDLFELSEPGKSYVQYSVFVRNSDWAEPFDN